MTEAPPFIRFGFKFRFCRLLVRLATAGCCCCCCWLAGRGDGRRPDAGGGLLNAAAIGPWPYCGCCGGAPIGRGEAVREELALDAPLLPLVTGPLALVGGGGRRWGGNVLGGRYDGAVLGGNCRGGAPPTVADVGGKYLLAMLPAAPG